MKAQRTNGKVTAGELENQIRRLQDDLFDSDVQFELFVGLRKAAPSYKEELQCSGLFWQYTIEAHITIVILRLCRIYDTDEKTFSLPAFLKTIEMNGHLFTKEAFIERKKDSPHLESLLEWPRELDFERLKEAQFRCSPNNPIVKNLLLVRHHFVAHTNHKLAFRGAEAFQRKFPLPFKDIKGLIQNGFETVNVYASLFGAAHMPGVNETNYPVDDFQFVLDAMKDRFQKLYAD